MLHKHRQSSKIIKKVVSCILSVLMCLTGCSFRAWADLHPNAAQLLPQPISLFNLQIPQGIGTIKEKFEGNEGKTLFIVQDAHAVPDAQRSIEKLIEFSQKQYGVDVIAFEGAASDLDPLILKSFPDKTALKKVFKKYLNSGELTGANAAAIFSQSPAKYYGIEDWDLYQDGLGYFQDAMSIQNDLNAALEKMFEALQAEKKRTYSKQLLLIDQALRAFREDSADLMDVLEKLSAVEPPRKGSELADLLEQTGHAKKNNTGIEAEVKKIAAQIKSALIERQNFSDIPVDLTEFNRKFQEFQTSQISAENMALFLKELSIKHKIRVRVSKKLNVLTGRQKRMSDIEGTRFFDEFESYAATVKESLFRSREERRIDFKNHILELIERLAALKLSRKEWTEVKSLLVRTDAWDLASDGIDRQSEIAQLLYQMKSHIEFYENAEKRDHVFIQKTKELFKKHNVQVLTMVAGGFHADGITELLRDAGISYALIMPEIQSLPEENQYHAHMQGKVSWNGYFQVRDGKVNLHEAFIRATRDKLLESSTEHRVDSLSTLNAKRSTLKKWRDQIIRDLAEENRLEEAKDYTRFIDELTLSRPDRKERTPVIGEWRANVEKFITGLRGLQNTHQLTEQNIAALLPQATIGDGPTYAGLAAKAELRAELVPAIKAQSQQPAAHAELRTMDRRTMLKLTAGVAATVMGGGVLSLPQLQDIRQQNISRGRNGRSKRGQISLNAPWENFISTDAEPFDAENIRHDLLVTLDWLSEGGYQYQDVIDQYAGSLEYKLKIDEEMNVPMRKVYDPDMERFLIHINPRSLHEILTAVQKARSMDLFVSTLGFMIVREAWGLEMAHYGYADRGEQASKDITEVDSERRTLHLRERHMSIEDPVFSHILKKYDKKIENSLMLYFSMEVYEALRQSEFLGWAKNRGLLDPQKAEQDYARLASSFQNSFVLLYQTGRIALRSNGQGAVIVNDQLRGLTRAVMRLMGSVFSSVSHLSEKIVIYNLFLAAQKGFFAPEILEQAKRGRQPLYNEYLLFSSDIWQKIKPFLAEMEESLPEAKRLVPHLKEAEELRPVLNRDTQQESSSERSPAARDLKPQTPAENLPAAKDENVFKVSDPQFPGFEERYVPHPDDEKAFLKWMEDGMQGEPPLQRLIREFVPVRTEMRTEWELIDFNPTTVAYEQAVQAFSADYAASIEKAPGNLRAYSWQVHDDIQHLRPADSVYEELLNPEIKQIMVRADIYFGDTEIQFVTSPQHSLHRSATENEAPDRVIEVSYKSLGVRAGFSNLTPGYATSVLFFSKSEGAAAHEYLPTSLLLSAYADYDDRNAAAKIYVQAIILMYESFLRAGYSEKELDGLNLQNFEIALFPGADMERYGYNQHTPSGMRITDFVRWARDHQDSLALRLPGWIPQAEQPSGPIKEIVYDNNLDGLYFTITNMPDPIFVSDFNELENVVAIVNMEVAMNQGVLVLTLGPQSVEMYDQSWKNIGKNLNLLLGRGFQVAVRAEARTQKRRILQFRMRAFLLWMTLGAAFLGWQIHRYYSRQAFELIEKSASDDSGVWHIQNELKKKDARVMQSLLSQASRNLKSEDSDTRIGALVAFEAAATEDHLNEILNYLENMQLQPGEEELSRAHKAIRGIMSRTPGKPKAYKRLMNYLFKAGQWSVLAASLRERIPEDLQQAKRLEQILQGPSVRNYDEGNFAEGLSSNPNLNLVLAFADEILDAQNGYDESLKIHVISDTLGGALIKSGHKISGEDHHRVVERLTTLSLDTSNKKLQDEAIRTLTHLINTRPENFLQHDVESLIMMNGKILRSKDNLTMQVSAIYQLYYIIKSEEIDRLNALNRSQAIDLLIEVGLTQAFYGSGSYAINRLQSLYEFEDDLSKEDKEQLKQGILKVARQAVDPEMRAYTQELFSFKRSEIRKEKVDIIERTSQSAANAIVKVVNALMPGADELEVSSISEIYSLAVKDLEGLIQAIKEILEQRIAQLSDESQAVPEENTGVLALRGAIDLAKRLLTPSAGEHFPENITFAVNFSSHPEVAVFLDQLFHEITDAGVSSEILSDSNTHIMLSRKITQTLQKFIRLKRLSGMDLQQGAVVSEEGLGVITALDQAETAGELNALFQGLFFDETGIDSNDSDAQLAGRIVFAAVLIRLAIVSAQNKSTEIVNRADFLKAELIRAIGEAGYSASSNAFTTSSGGLISIMGNTLINALVQDVRVRAEIRIAA